MKSPVRTFVLLTLSLALALPLAAAQKGAKKRKGKRGARIAADLLRKVEKAELTEEQKKKIDDVIAEYGPKITEARSKVSRETLKALADARKKAQAEGKKGKALREAVNAAVSLSEEEKAAMAEARELNAALRKAVIEVLTPEQREKAGLKLGRRKGGRRKKNQ